MVNTGKRIVASAFAAALGFANLAAYATDSFEEAKKFFAAGKYGEVDAALGTLLERRPVQADILTLSFEAAIKDGRFYTAERRYGDLVAKGDKIRPEVAFKAALVANAIGKPGLRRDRLIYFLKNETGWNDNVEQALILLCRTDFDGAHFARLMQREQPTETLFMFASEILRASLNAKRDIPQIADAILAKFHDSHHASRIVYLVREYFSTLPQPVKADVFSAMSRYPIGGCDAFRSLALSDGNFSAKQVIDYAHFNKALLPIPLFSRIADFKSSVTTEERQAYAQKAIALKDTILARAQQPAADASAEAKAAYEPQYLIHYLRMIASCPELFFTDGAPMRIPSAEMAKMFWLAASSDKDGSNREILRKLASDCYYAKAWSTENAAQLAASFPQLFDTRALFFDSKIMDQVRQTKNTAKIVEILEKNRDRLDLWKECLSIFFDSGDAAMLKKTAEMQIMARPLDFDSENLARYFLSSPSMSVAERVNFMRSLYARTGHSEAWRKMVSFGALPIDLKEDAGFKSFVESVKPDSPAGTDPIAGSITSIAKIPQPSGNGTLDPKAFDLAKKAITAYGGQFPGADAVKSSQMASLWNVMRQRCQTPEDKGKAIAIFVRVFGKKAPFQELLNFASESRNPSNYIAVASASLKVGAFKPDYFSQLHYPKNFPNSILAPYYKEMSATAVASHLQNNWDGTSWPLADRFKQFNLAMEAHPITDYQASTLDWFFTRIYDELSATNRCKGMLNLEPLAKTFIDERKGSSYIRAKIAGLYAVEGKAAEIVPRYFAASAKDEPAIRFADFMSLCGRAYSRRYLGEQLIPLVPLERENEAPSQFQFGALLRDFALPAVKAIPIRQAGMMQSWAESAYFTDRFNDLESRAWSKRANTLPDEVLNEFAREVSIRAQGGGMSLPQGDWFRRYRIVRRGFSSFINRGENERAAMTAWYLGQVLFFNWDSNGDGLLGVLKTAMGAEAWEPAHIVASAVHDLPEHIFGRFQRIRSDCSTHMPGIYPVDESSPLYPLYVAADELERNNSERSWALLNDQKNLQTFEREASKLPPGFVAWAVEQLRRVRGKDDVQLIRARKIASSLLSKESTLTPELAASLMLTRAECYRDQRNFTSAQLEYQTIRNGAFYKGTKAARKAMFRDVDLLIEMGSVAQAEQIVELWLSQPDVDIQAQAHYFMAKIAFERKDFEETRKQLEEVFSLDYTHTDARLLHGQWKLATNSEVDDTNVWVGDLSDRTIIRPGQELTISVQDRNLGIAGGGNSIPVVITTSAGKDRELLNLYPSVRNPALFSGSVSTMLGEPKQGNHILEVCGSDEVSYVIDPAFLSARGLKTNEPKVLRIVDDARLAIGAAAPLAEDGRAEEELEQLILSTGDSDRRNSAISQNLKPGNPIYVVVRDRDRSLSVQPDTISVDAKTSSGDRLESIILTETDGVSGIFRGEIPSCLPPPRAFASDSAVGSNPGDAINSTRNDPEKNLWKSAPDGAQGKWFEVDTMGSHVVSNAAIMMPAATDVTSIRLTGTLAGERMVLATLPKGDLSKRYGIHSQIASGPRLNKASLIRSHFSAKGAAAPQVVSTLAFKPIQGRDMSQNAMLSVPFVMPKDENTIRFRFEAVNTKGRTLEGLWMAIAIDGIEVFSGQGNSLHMMSVPIQVSAGPHHLEMFFSALRQDDALLVKIEGTDGSVSDLPAAWTDPKTNPELEDFVKDVAEIHRIEGGFQAAFSKPVRLRSLRWEFLGYNGREIAVKKLYVQDVGGKMVIPVESDYSDALRNDTLEVAPGDKITVSYSDERTSSGERRVLERTMTSSFHDASLNFFFEEIRQTPNGNSAFLYDAYRFVPGDMLIIAVTDPDSDVSPEADKVTVRISTRSGISANMTLEESNRSYFNRFGNNGKQGEGVHGGVFMGLLRTCDSTVTNIPRGTLPISNGDVITMAYHDRENTNPGVPTERSVSVMAAQPTEPHLILFDTVTEKIEDTSYDAKLRLAQIRRRPGNENIDKLYKDVITATSIPAERIAPGEDIPANVATAIPLAIIDPSRARHEASTIKIDAVADSELEDAEMTGREPDIYYYSLKLGSNLKGMKSNLQNPKVPGEMGLFSGVIDLCLGPPDPSVETIEGVSPALPVNGNDRIRVRIFAPDGSVQEEIWFRLVSDAKLSLTDSSYTAERNMAHVGERFFIMLRDADQDDGDDLNSVEIEVAARGSKVKRKAILRETLPHSGIFTGTIRPVIFAPGEDIPAIATGGVAVAEEDYLDDRIAVRYGDKLEFTYMDASTIPSKEPGAVSVSGDVFKGSDGSVRLFSKHFRDIDTAVLVQFRLAECLFESAKEFRRLKQPERSAASIDEGKQILEDALKNYPTTSHLAQGEYLLANLYQELANEEKDENKQEAEKLYSEALSRFSAILSTWPESEFAPKAQYHKALCLEMLGDYNSSSEEYVKMTYLYPDSPLVGDAAIRLATHYYKENRFDTAGRIYSNFQRRFPTHEKADRALFMSAQCHMKQAQFLSEKAKKDGVNPPAALINEEYKQAVASLDSLIEQYRETAAVSLRSQALYWAGDASLRAGDYQAAFIYLKRTTFEYPETEWARRARGLLLQEAKAFEKLE